MTRREFARTGLAAAIQAPARFRKGICAIIFPKNMPLEEQFRQARNAGFEGLEIPLGDLLPLDTDRDQARRLAEAARKSGIEIISLWVSAPLSPNPLNHPDPAVRARGVEALRRALTLASWMECGALLIVPGRLGTGPKFQFGYQDTWDRVSAELKKVVPEAEKARVCLLPENVWNRFLVSPLEMRTFVDQFQSVWVGAYFDIGNILQYGYPQDWILTLGARIKRVHAKDYKLSTRAEQGRFVELLEGDVDWKEVMAALVKVGYRGFISPEYGHRPEDPGYLRKV
ncbi:MAG: sugar phosphate isomerase/epimerase family protein, partial [Bryobacterales bacterium]|nr:sugar phosphate isomerase/epimerase [Bryobacteraceae bacterium]MDW8129340.1 sugar phosphate isomerase/epimerase family protein [Bryobacterales bacterium]